jgi:hypothetical protein
MNARSGCKTPEGFGMKLTLSQLALVTLIAATPAAAEPNVLSSHEVRFRHITFTCGEVRDQGKQRRFLYSAPYKINLPTYEPLPGEAGSSGWQVVYRTICEKAKQRSRLASAR